METATHTAVNIILQAVRFTKSLFSHLLLFIIDRLIPNLITRITKYEVERLRAIKALIEKNYQEHIIIPDLAIEAAMSATKLKAEFKRLFQVTLYEYLVQVRMEKAKALLDGTELFVKRIAIHVGYKNSASFIKAFKKIFSITPEEYRKGQKRA